MEPMIEIPVSVYHELLDAAEILGKLRAAGVDNWEGYQFAFEDDPDDTE